MAGNTVLQGGFGGLPNWMEIMISDDGMEASLLIKDGEEIGIKMIQPIKNYLRRAGIQVPLLDEVIEHMVKRRLCDEFHPVAKGMPPRPGKNGYYEYFFNVDARTAIPKLLPDGTVDYSNVLVMVNEGDVLAEHHWPEQGADGCKVNGEIVPAGQALDVPPLILSGVVQSGNRFIASKSGRVTLRDTLKGKALSVDTAQRIENDIDHSYGNVRYGGDLFIRGDVWSGMHVEAEGCIIIDGTVNGAHLTAGKDIVIGYGVSGEGKALLEAGGDLACNYIENTFVNVNGRVVTGSIVNSEVFAGQDIDVTMEEKGIIMGGCVCGMTGVAVNVAGHRSGISTEIYAGASKKNTEQIRQFTQAAKSYLSYLERIDAEEKQLQNAIKKAGDTIQGEQLRKKLETVTNEKLQLDMNIGKNQWELNRLLKRIDYAKEAEVSVKKQVFEGVKITVGTIDAEIPVDGMRSAQFVRGAGYVQIITQDADGSDSGKIE